jgi:hypothetical protein
VGDKVIKPYWGFCPLLPQQAHGGELRNFIVRPRIHNMYKASVSPGSVQQIMPYLIYDDSYILSARTMHWKHTTSVVACVSVGVPMWSVPSQFIYALAAAYQLSRSEPHRKHRSYIFGRLFVWACLTSNGVFWLHSLMLWANPSQYPFMKVYWFIS